MDGGELLWRRFRLRRRLWKGALSEDARPKLSRRFFAESARFRSLSFVFVRFGPVVRHPLSRPPFC
jgi:hypothetical protein